MHWCDSSDIFYILTLERINPSCFSWAQTHFVVFPFPELAPVAIPDALHKQEKTISLHRPMGWLAKVSYEYNIQYMIYDDIWYMNRWIHRQLWYQIYHLFTYLSIDTVNSVTRSFWVWRGLSWVATFRPWETRCVPPQRIILNSSIDSSTCLAASLAGCSVQSMYNEASLQNQAT